MLLFLQNGNWVDRSCEEKHGFICMKHSATESTGEEVEVNIGCKAVSQACFLHNIAAGIVRQQSSHTSAGCSAEISHGTFLPQTFKLASCTLTCGDIYNNAEIISSFCDAFGKKIQLDCDPHNLCPTGLEATRFLLLLCRIGDEEI